MDVHDSVTRSYNMSQIKGKDTQPEMLVRKFLFGNGFRYRLHDKKLPGKPDIILKKFKTVIFVNGCFWHGHEGCKYFKIPETRTEWWKEKFEKNKANDEKNKSLLISSGWKVITIYGCELKKDKREATFMKLLTQLKHS
ncbi:MAG: DNA mismatch endonuclease Vsr [Saprospiraceae bacterium]|nr:DNA mismatch endonuclease Vsr [Saprospiraceae bacterium]